MGRIATEFVAAALLMLPVAADAHAPSPAIQPPPAAQPVPAAQPSNSVRCAFESLTIEDREIALLLIGLDFQGSGRFSKVAPDNKLVNRLVDEALAKCTKSYRWPADAALAASNYSHKSLVLEVLRQAIEYGEHAVEPIDSYFTAHKSELTAKPDLTDTAEEGFATYLKQNGWKTSERSAIRLARTYLESLVARDIEERAFAQATARPVVKPKSQKRPARPARRGRT